MNITRIFSLIALVVLSLPSFSSDFKATCEANGIRIVRAAMSDGTSMRDWYEGYLKLSDQEAHLNQDRIINDLVTNYDGFRHYDYFILLNEPSKVFNKGVYYMGIYDLNEIVGDSKVPLKELHKNLHKRLDSYITQGPLPHTKHPFHRFQREMQRETQLAALGTPYFCFGTGHFGCNDGLRSLFLDSKLMTEDGGYWFIYTDYAAHYLTDPTYHKGTMLTAKKLLKNIEHIEQSRTSLKSKLINDVVESFKEAGQSEKQAIHSAYMTLMFYSLRGASTNALIEDGSFDSDYTPLLYAHSIIGLAIGYLDKYTYDGTTYYSLPPGVSTPCVYGKAYHVWLAAFQTYLLHNVKKKPVNTSFVSSYVSSVIYNAFADHSHRNAFTADYDRVRSPINDGHRIDLIFNLTGATAFLGYQMQTPLMFDKMVKDSKALSSDVERNFYNWKTVIAPYSFFNQ